MTGLGDEERRDLERFALEQADVQGTRRRRVLEIRNGRLRAHNHVGIIETRHGTVIEILPKIDLSHVKDDTGRTGTAGGARSDGFAHSFADQHQDTRQVFLSMLRDWRGLGQAEFDPASIRATRRFDMLEAFVHLFLTNVVLLTQRGVARAYQRLEANLPCLRGRILFGRHVCENLLDRSRFYVGYYEFTTDRPANRLIHVTLQRLMKVVRHPSNRQRILQLCTVFSEVPASTNVDDDWARHQVDRSMRHYDAVMSWVGLFLFHQGLTTFAGPWVSRALLFPMEEVFEDFVTAAIRRHQRRFTVYAQGPTRPLAKDSADQRAFWMKPDIVLKEKDKTQFVLDAKWKHLEPGRRNYGVGQGDAYQLFTYGRLYGCQRVVLLYPRTSVFRETVEFRFMDDGDLPLACFPFNVADPENTVRALMRDLLR